MMSMLLLFVVSCGTKEFSVDVDGKGKVPNFELKDLNGKSADLGKIMKNGKKTLFIVAAVFDKYLDVARTILTSSKSFVDILDVKSASFPLILIVCLS